MRKLVVSGILVSMSLVGCTSQATVTSDNPQANSIKSVLDAAWDEFGLFVYIVEETDLIISIGMDETKSEEKLREFLNENLSEADLNKYNIKIFKKTYKNWRKNKTVNRWSFFMPLCLKR